MAAKLEGALGRGDRFFFDPETLVIIGLDTKDGPEHPLYDERAKLDADPAMVATIKMFGVIEDVVVRKNGDTLEVLDGRQRVKNARAANKELKKEGKDLVRVPVTIRKGDDIEAAGVGLVTNEVRTADSPLIKAKKAQRMLDKGAEKAYIAACLGVKQVALNSLLALLDLDVTVQRAVDAGELSASAASKLVGLKREEQKEKLAELKTTAESTGKKKVTAKDTKKAANPNAVIPPSRALLRKMFEALPSSTERDIVGWIIGEYNETTLKGVMEAAFINSQPGTKES